MATVRGDGSSIGAGMGPVVPGTVRADISDIPSGFATRPSGTLHAGGPDITSGFGPPPGALANGIKPGDPILINGITYTFNRAISKSTGEAEIFLIAQLGKPCVFKLYYPNFKPNIEILAQLKQLKHEDIINVIDYGYFHERFFEIMEFAEGGKLEQHLPIRDPLRLRKIVSETVNAFKFCHAHGIIHKDIKPGNLFFKNADGTDIVIGDFGISSALDAGESRRMTSQSLTVGYASPEMYGIADPADGRVKIYVGREVDYYALGITLIHLWQAKSPFDGLNIHAIANLTCSGAIMVPDDLPGELQTLIRGLITIDFAKRWGYAEVQRWLKGEDVPVHFHVKESTYPPFQFGVREEAISPEALANLLKTSPDKGKKLFYSGKISAWVNLFDHGLATELDRVIEEEYPKTQDAGLQKAIFILNPNEPFSQNGRECRSSGDLAAALDDGFSFYVKLLSDPNHPFYLFLEAHKAKKEADTFRAYFNTFSPKKALNTVILELSGRQSVSVLGQVFTTPDAVLHAQDQASLVTMLQDRESKLSLWIEGAANPTLKAQLEAWRALKVCNSTTLAYVSSTGDGVPHIELSRNSFSFDDLKCRAVISDSFEIRNTGGGTLKGPITSSKNWLRLARGSIDSSQKTQLISFSIDTAGLPFGATDTAEIEVQSNVGVETISVAIAIELGVKAASRFRTWTTLEAGLFGSLLGLVIHKASSMIGVNDPSTLAGLSAVVGLAIAVWAVVRKSGKFPLRSGLLTLASGLVALGFLQATLPLIYAVASWALLFMVATYVIAPTILVGVQTTKNRITVPLGILVGSTALCGGILLGDKYVSKWISDGTGNVPVGKRDTGLSGNSPLAPGGKSSISLITAGAQNIFGAIDRVVSPSEPPMVPGRDGPADVRISDDIQVASPKLPGAVAALLRTRGLKMPTSISKECMFDFSAGRNPFILEGDFDGDRRRDYAVSTEVNKNYGRTYIVLANGQIHETDGYEFIRANKTRGDIETLDGVVSLQHDSFEGVHCEKSSVLYVYNKATRVFDKFFTSD